MEVERLVQLVDFRCRRAWGAQNALSCLETCLSVYPEPSNRTITAFIDDSIRRWDRVTMTLRATTLLPGQVLELAAACTLGPSLDVDTDAEMRSLIFSHFRVSGSAADVFFVGIGIGIGTVPWSFW